MTGPVTGIKTVTVSSPCGKPITSGLGDMLTFVNMDNVNDVQLSYTQFSYGDSNATTVAAGNGIALPDSAPMYAITADPTISVQVNILPGAGPYTEGAIQIATQLLPLAVDIAEELLATGIPQVAGAVPLYDIEPAQNPAIPVGATVNINDYGDPTWNASAVTYDGYVGRPMAATIQKVYLNPGQTFTAVPLNISQLSSIGCKIILCFQPSTSALTVANRAAVANMCAILQRANVDYDAVLNQEPNVPGKFSGPAAYAAYVAWYAPAICNPAAYFTLGGTAPSPVNLVYNPAAGSANAATALSYYPGDGPGYTHYAIAVDFYATSFINDGTTLAPMLALAEANLKAFGVIEAGPTSGTVGPHNPAPTPAQWYTSGDSGSYCVYIVETIQAATVQYGLCMFNANRVPGAIDLVTGPTDFKIQGIQYMYDSLSVSSTAFTINAGASTSLVPLEPTPGAGYALAQGISYDITLNLTAGAASTNPYCIVRVFYYNKDSAGAVPVNTKYWYLPLGKSTTIGTTITGAGAQYGQFKRIQVKNLDTDTMTLICQVNSTSRPVEDGRSWEWDTIASPALPAYQVTTPNGMVTVVEPGGAPFSNSLGSLDSVNLLPMTSKAYLLSMFAGKVWVKYDQMGATGEQVQIQVVPQPESVFGGGPVINDFIGTGPPFEEYVEFPRCPCVLIVSNNQSSGSVTVSFEAIAHR